MGKFLAYIKSLSTAKLTLMITAFVVAIILLVSAVVFVVNAIVNDIFFDYNTTNLSDYITLTKGYKDFEINVDIAEPHYDIDIATSKINMLCNDKPKDVWIEGSEGAYDINPGDVVYIWYRGCVIVDGEELWLDGMTNIPDSTKSYGLEIGSNGFVPGFELGLVGQRTTSFDDLEFIKEGAVLKSEATVAYISYKIGTTETKTERVDLTAENLDEKYGEGFKAHLLGKTIGKSDKFTTKRNGTDIIYDNLTVDFATKNEDKGLLIENIYFPYDYKNDTTLRNLDAKFYVYFDKIDRYYKETPEFNDEYVKQKIEDGDIAITLEELEKYGLEGDTLVQKYEAYAKELLGKIYESERENAIVSTIWDYYFTNAKFDKKKLPQSKVDEVYYELAYDLYNQYETSGGILNGYYQYDSFEDYANAACGITSTSQYYKYGDEAWKWLLMDRAAEMVKENIILFHILRDSNSIPDEEALKARVEELKQAAADDYIEKNLDDYISDWLTDNEKKKEDYTDAEWEQLEKERSDELRTLYSAYYELQNKDQVYLVLLSEKVMEWVENKEITIHSLDVRHNYKKAETK